MKKLKEVLQAGAQRLSGLSNTPGLDAEVLLCYAGNFVKTDLVIKANEGIDDLIVEKFCSYIERRSGLEPVAYILGKKDFWDFTLAVTPDVLVPRPETEQLVEEGLRLLRTKEEPFSILDLGTGSGCLAIALARELKKKWKKFSIVAVDYSSEALAIAKKNVQDQFLGSVISFEKSDWFSELNKESKFDLIVSNPPYVADRDPRVSKELAFEPAAALYAGSDGLEAIRVLMRSAGEFLKRGGDLLFEIGDTQGEAVRAFCNSEESLTRSYSSFRILEDLSGKDRVVRMQLKGKD